MKKRKKIKPAAKKAAAPHSPKASKRAVRAMSPKESLHKALLRNNELLAELVGIAKKMAPAITRIADAVAKGGNVYKGPKTPFMANQLKMFAEHLKGDPVVKGDNSRTIYCIAKRFWGKHREEFDRAAKLKDNTHGYASPKILADAHKNLTKANAAS